MDKFSIWIYETYKNTKYILYKIKKYELIIDTK